MPKNNFVLLTSRRKTVENSSFYGHCYQISIKHLFIHIYCRFKPKRILFAFSLSKFPRFWIWCSCFVVLFVLLWYSCWWRHIGWWNDPSLACRHFCLWECFRSSLCIGVCKFCTLGTWCWMICTCNNCLFWLFLQ